MAQRISVLAVLGESPHDYARLAVPLLRALDPRRFRVEAGPLPAGGADVVLAATDQPITARQAASLRTFVRRGGGLVLLHSTLASWAESPAIADLAGWTPGGQGSLTELVVRPEVGHPVTRRMPAEWRLTDELFLAEGPPLGASVWLRASWRFTDQVVAYERPYGDGRVVFIGLGHGSATYEDATFQKLIGRTLQHAAGRPEAEAVGVGLIGYGAIGRDHAASIVATPGLRLVAVCDLAAERRESASREWDVRGYARREALLDDADVGLVVVGTPPSAHADGVLAALRAGKHVVCEKPFALHVDDTDRMMDAAAANGRTLTVYQSRRWDPDYVAMRNAVRSGAVGDPFYMESFVGGYDHPCGLWHSHEPISGGTIYDWGSHYFDWILQLFNGRVTTVAAQAHKRVWHDVTNADQVRVDVTFAEGAQATFLQSDIAAARKPKWYVLGTRGAIVADWADAPVPADLPARITVHRPTGEEVLKLAPREEHAFYRNLADHLAWGEPLAVSAEDARRNVAVMEAATRSLAEGGAQVKVEI